MNRCSSTEVLPRSGTVVDVTLDYILMKPATSVVAQVKDTNVVLMLCRSVVL